MRTGRNFTEELSNIDSSVVESVQRLEDGLKSSGVNFESKPLTVEEMSGSAPVAIERHFTSANTSQQMYF